MYCYSKDGETYHGLDAETFEDAVIEAKQTVADGSVDIWIGETVTPEPPTLGNVEDIILDQMFD